MTCTFTIVPASTQAAKETIRILLSDASKPRVRAIYRDPSKAPTEFTSNSNFTALQGDVTTGKGLDFIGSDAVFYIPPPFFDPGDQTLADLAAAAANHVKQALEKAPSVKRLLLFSSMGAENDHGIGILKINHISDKILKTAAPEVVIVKPGYFQENWARAFETARAEHAFFDSPLSPIDNALPMVSIKDVGRVCARKLLELSVPLPERTYFFELFGPRHYSVRDVQLAVEEIVGKKVDVVLIEKEKLGEYFAGMEVPESVVREMVEFTTAALPGGVMYQKFDGDERTVRGEVELVDALRAVYTA
ncbi:NmrA family protein [Colletotrichum karsti]|uniref:NmrA family protein n=1 Tax=Colletotrichum karsti TaxID=1095194 RepID=A0A9P6I722_9PEZI|nr:NmrA family protein [Colletotrichum karsti]KAF9877533.1 NmrA family protein [Colletotrichum karsti]